MDIAGRIDAVMATRASGLGNHVIPSLSPRQRESGTSSAVARCEREGCDSSDIACDPLGVNRHDDARVG
jgi:hypothetical protein